MVKFSITKFQFHNGTINTILTSTLWLIVLRFNSTTVQLIQNFKDVPDKLEGFQFHNGTINTFSTNYLHREKKVSIPQRYN